MSLCHGPVSKALLMSIVASVVLSGGYLLLNPSKISCVIVERYVMVECCDRKPCCEGVSGVCGVICLRMSLSKI